MEAMCSMAHQTGTLERGVGVGAGQSTPFLSVSPSSGTHLGAVAARLARWQVLTEPMAQMCGTEPNTRGATRLELKGRWAAVLWREREECQWRDRQPMDTTSHKTEHMTCYMVPVTPSRGHLVIDNTKLSCCLPRLLSPAFLLAPTCLGPKIQEAARRRDYRSQNCGDLL